MLILALMPQAPASRQGRPTGVTGSLDAEDVVGTAPTREGRATQVRPRREPLLHDRGRTRRAAKPRRVPGTAGCTVWGCPRRPCGRRALPWRTVPHKAPGRTPLRGLRASRAAQQPPPAGPVLQARHPVRRGGAPASRHVSAQDVGAQGGQAPGPRRWRGATRRHPKQRGAGVKARSERENGSGAFRAGQAAVGHPARTPLTRVTQVAGPHAPSAPTRRHDWLARRTRPVGRAPDRQQRLRLPHSQGDRGTRCPSPCVPGDAIAMDQSIPTRHGGTEDLDPTRLVHPWCHRPRHPQDGRQRPRA